MKRILFFFLVFLLFVPCSFLLAQVPTVDPIGTYYRTNEEGTEETGDVNGQTLSAPFRVVFTANPTIPDGYTNNPHYTWTITNTKNSETTPIVRDQEEFELEFNESGSYTVELRVIFYGEEGVSDDYEFPNLEEEDSPKIISFSVSESKLEFPNGISPNGDERNDVLKAKEGYKSIVSFHAAVFNRWGKKLYSWDDIRGGWDGKYNGKVVKDGVYFLVVSAKGSDGINYNIKKAINVISGYNNGENENGSGSNE